MPPWPARELRGALGIWRRARCILWRGAVLSLGILTLANPVMVREQRQPLGDIAVLLIDRTPSQTINERPDQITTTLNELRASLETLDDLEVIETSVEGGKGGTLLFDALATSLAEIDRSRVAGVR